MIETIIAICLAYLGFLTASLCQRSRRNLIAGTPSRRLRQAAWLAPASLLLVSLSLLILIHGAGFGFLFLFEITAPICLAVALTVRRPRPAFRVFRVLLVSRTD